MSHMNCLPIVSVAVLLGLSAHGAAAASLPRAREPLQIRPRPFWEEVRAFDDPVSRPVAWTTFVVNAGFGGGRGASERWKGWIAEHWQLLDYMDRSGDYASHHWLKHRGIWFEIYGCNEYQETIHFHERGAKALFWDNGIARDQDGERVLCPEYNTRVAGWAKSHDWDAYIACNNAPRWSALINYDLLTSPLHGTAVSQDNIGGPLLRTGSGSRGRYCDHCNRKFQQYLRATGRLPEYQRDYGHIRDYVQANQMDLLRQLPPYDTSARFTEKEAERIGRICADPVMAEYQKVLYLSHLHNFMRYYRDLKVVADRLGRPFSVHGNQGGGFMGPDAYQVVVSDFVDTLWYESSGLSAYDMFKYGWNNAWGAFRFEIGRAMLRGRKPLICMTKFRKLAPDMVAHELAEPCAGGAVLFVRSEQLEADPVLRGLMTDYFAFRQEHRALFVSHERRRHCQVALLYSVPTMMYGQYQAAVAAPPVSAMSGLARALEEGHIPFDVAILNHPEIHPDFVSGDELKRYRLLILPETECLSDAQVGVVTSYLDTGGTVGVIGNCGVRDENNRPRPESAVEQWRQHGRVLDLTPTPYFCANRTEENEQTRATTRAVIKSTRAALEGQCLVRGELPRLLWVKSWVHDCGVAAFHFVNYNLDFESGTATSTDSVRVTLRLPDGVECEEAQFLVPGQAPRSLTLRQDGTEVSFELPSVRVYGVVVIGKPGLHGAASALLRGDGLVARAEFACDGNWGSAEPLSGRVRVSRPPAGTSVAAAEAYARSARELLDAVAVEQQERLVNRVQQMADTAGAVLALDFGGQTPTAGWQVVAAETAYDADVGYGWLPSRQQTEPMPEELYYGNVQSGEMTPAHTIQNGYAIFWPYKTRPPATINRCLYSGVPRTFRIDLQPGLYDVSVVSMNPTWNYRNLLASGMVQANGRTVLLDIPLFKGGFESRRFTIPVDGVLELGFGGATGWGVASVVVRPAEGEAREPLAEGAIREWRLSPRFGNPEWAPIAETHAPPEDEPAKPSMTSWLRVSSAAEGIGLVDLGPNTAAEVGDVTYAVASLDVGEGRQAVLHLGSTSAMLAWLNGERIAYLPNQKGVLRDESTVPVALKPGRNVLLLKLCRFWERRWLFYASLTPVEGQ